MLGRELGPVLEPGQERRRGAPEHLGEPGSEPRNPKIAAVLHEMRFAETKGSGIRVMREGMEQAGLTPPLFESDRGGDLLRADGAAGGRWLADQARRPT